MLSEHEKFLINIQQIIGFAMMTPFSKISLEWLVENNEPRIVNFVVSIIFLLIGIIVLGSTYKQIIKLTLFKTNYGEIIKYA